MDHHATTPVDPRVLEAMLPYFTEQFGNPASRNHPYGWRAEEGVEKARERVARLIGASPKEILFTSGATESDNLAVQGVAAFYEEKGDHIITSVLEHKAILDTCRELERRGVKVTYLPVGEEGIVDPADVRKAITPKTILISIMRANNEIGTLQPTREIGRIAREHGILFHTDAVQGVGRVPFDVEEIQVDLVSLSAHKMYGPKGVGALYVRSRSPRVRLRPLLFGGGQERGIRSGTLNVPGIVGFGLAAELARELLPKDNARIGALRDRLHRGLVEALDGVQVNGSLTHRLPGNLNVSVAAVEGESLLMGLRGVAVSSGATCISASLEPSYVLKAIGVPDNLAHSSLRFGLGRFNTEAEVDYVIQEVIRNVRALREVAPLYGRWGTD